MTQQPWVVGGLATLAGVLVSGVGLAAAHQSLDNARRSHRKTTARAASGLDGWGGWFLQGFSGLALGLQWMASIGAWLAWAATGLAFAWIGIRTLG